MLIQRFKNELFLILIIISILTGIHYSDPLTGIKWGINIGLIAVPFLLIINLLEYFFKPSKLLKYINIVLLITSLFFIFMQHKKIWFPSSDHVFNRVFNIEKPKSITDLKSYVDDPGRGDIFRLKFKVNKVDFDNIIKKLKINKIDKSKEGDYSDEFIFEDLGVSYLRFCKKLSWWDIRHLKSLPQYVLEHYCGSGKDPTDKWINYNPRRLWVEHLDSNIYIVYVSGCPYY